VLRRDVAPWLAPAALLVAFVLTFFPWVGVYPNGMPVYTQNAWKAARGTFAADPAGDEVMKRAETLESHKSLSLTLIFYLILLVPAVLLGVVDRALPLLGAPVPDVFRSVWVHRQVILLGLSAALLVLLLLALTLGFGLESAAAWAAEEAVPAAGDAPTAARQKRDLRRDVELASFGLARTTWLSLAVVAHVVALAGAGVALWLDRHPSRAEPRVECYC
jgi:hypothetical protein